eukprot:5664791-Alexandrium_andersonii.AAC.1
MSNDRAGFPLSNRVAARGGGGARPSARTSAPAEPTLQLAPRRPWTPWLKREPLVRAESGASLG